MTVQNDSTARGQVWSQGYGSNSDVLARAGGTDLAAQGQYVEQVRGDTVGRAQRVGGGFAVGGCGQIARLY